ncbi:Chromo domain-containing protein 1 [Pyrenophora tritici-repentis]|uniref:Chromo domain-containing protein n=2 Tax=Pyrenophora tritici-repentis TaxID=45151 RepID=A0A2W1EAA3_9PLEO|nr:Chromo domain-containing protein 1 [Pyrenophora tritici-repentis]KAI0572949.1 Chromo domain-containing protein 1 [Pyrenophora tritici-repentis]KAI0606256.1 Chromo domain-containing protein 1 [Pyrenophora tritici-repentis]KAI0618299.1 Chromo domain-containing protein 1 [Pyrenophora tritici-repentis]KAI1520458.1 Chromo domain-containing protein [Pyrenophora tritici-repentis]
MMPSSPGNVASLPYTNGHLSPLVAHMTTADSSSPQADSDLSDAREAAAADQASDVDAPGEEYDEDEEMAAASDSSEDVDAEGEPDGDYDSDSPPSERAESNRARSSSEESTRPTKRKASEEKEYPMEQNPELYGLRRSGRARHQGRRIVDSSDEDDDYSSDQPRKRQRTASRKTSNQPTPVYRSTGSDSESDGYVGARRNIPTKKQRQRQHAVAAGREPPSQAEVRFSARRTAQVANYNEEEDEDEFIEEDDEMTPNYWATATEDTGPVIDKILDHRPKDGSEIDPSFEKKDFEYLIKWQDKAHYHSSWEDYKTAASYKGYRKLDNYFKGPVSSDMYFHSRKDEDPEEFEQHMVAREAERESQLDFHVVERVIDSRDGEDETDYFVKWKGLTYEFCTWEPASLVSRLSQSEIDRFLDRSSNRPSSDLRETNPNTRRKFVKLDAQPDYIKYGQLRSFQLQGVNFLAHNWCRGTNVILADEMGLGKTVQTVSFINWLRHDRHQDGPMICVVPLSTMPAWADTFNNWTPDVNYVIYTGREEARAIIRDKELLVDGNTKKIKFNVLLTTYEYVLADWQFLQSIKWQFLAVDEAHRLKNRDSQLYDRLRQFNAPCRLLITGTPIQNTLGELAALMDFLMPGKISVDEHVDLASEDASRKLAELSDAIQPYMIRRTKEKVENDLPPKSEKILRVELSDIQLEYYKNILTRNYEALNEGGVGHKQSLLNIVMELKKASNHALLFPNAENKLVKPGSSKEETLKALITSSGKMMLLDRLLGKLKADGHRVLIFSQMVHMLDILTDYLKLRNYSFQRLDGTVPAADRKIAIDHFNAPGSEDYCFLLSTRAGGLGINLMTADTVVIFDSDWNPQADLQAMARAHRIGQQKPVSVYRLVSKDTIEEEILERARNKRMLEFITIQRGVTDRQQKELNDKMSRAAAEPNSADDINNILKRRGQKMFEQSGNQKKLEELDIDSVLENAEEHKTEQAAGLTSDGGEEFLKNFEYTDVKIDLEWDDIIPKEELEAVKADIQQRKDEEETQKLLEESAPRKRKAASSSAREQRAAKKRALEATHIDVDDDEQSEQDDTVGKDPKRPLNTKEVRNLIGAYYRYGSLDERADEMLQSAKLVGRDLTVVKATLDQIVAESTRLVKEEQTRLKNLEIEAKRAITKKDKKAVLFDFGNVKKVNAETILERPVEMRILKEAVEATPDWRNFRVPDAIKPASYSCPWGAREDGMLCIGIQRHGYGAWVNIRDDPELGLTDKFYLEEHRVDKKEERTKAEEKNAKSPGAVHLVRRANYLLTVLKDKSISDPSVKRLMENHHRNNKKNHLNAARRTDKANSVSASPAPSGPMRKMASRDSERPSQRTYSNGENRRPDSRTESRQYDRSREDRPRNSDQYRPSDAHRKEYRNDRGSVDRRAHITDRNGTPENRRKINGDLDRQRIRDDRPRLSEDRPRSHSQSQVPDRSVETPKPKEKKADDFLERKLRPVRDNLSRLKKATPKNYPQKDAMVKVLKIELIAIGNFIRAETRDNPELEERLWGYTITNHWPRPGVTVPAIKGMYNKMLSSEKPASGATGTNGQKNGV